jgi:hypothetical protein
VKGEGEVFANCIVLVNIGPENGATVAANIRQR